jgi:hypothetical protein|tara:strand:- start:127 stop:642 length:516 start_codon:yes stop_codon:yes gene_type:complete
MNQEEILYCQNCKNNETNLRCQKCNQLICYNCMKETPVGYRCSNCVEFIKPPMYKISVITLITSSLIAIVFGFIMGVISIFLIPIQSYYSFITIIGSGFFGLLISQILFIIINWSSNGKRGKKIQIIAVCSIILSSLIRLYISGNIEMGINDLNGFVYLLTGVIVLWDKFK